MEAGVCGRGCGGGREQRGGDEVGVRVNVCPVPCGCVREGADECVGETWGSCSGRAALGPQAPSLTLRSECVGTERTGTPQEGTTGDWGGAPVHHF